jgi:hypothetical protein
MATLILIMFILCLLEVTHWLPQNACQVSYAISLIYASYTKSLIYTTGATSNGCMPKMYPTQTSKSVLLTKFS